MPFFMRMVLFIEKISGYRYRRMGRLFVVDFPGVNLTSKLAPSELYIGGCFHQISALVICRFGLFEEIKGIWL